MARARLDDGLRGVIEGHPAVAQLLADYDAARARVAGLDQALELVWRRLLPDTIRNWRAENRPLPATAPVVPVWREAISALEADADAELPGEVPPAGPVAA